MKLIVTLVPAPNGILAMGWLGKQLLICVAPTAWECFEGMFAQAVCIQRARFPITVGTNGHG